MAFHDVLRKLMNDRDLSGSELARICGVPQTTVSQIYRGKATDPQWSTIQALAKGLNVPVTTFLDDAEPPPSRSLIVTYLVGSHVEEYLFPEGAWPVKAEVFPLKTPDGAKIIIHIRTATKEPEKVEESSVKKGKGKRKGKR